MIIGASSTLILIGAVFRVVADLFHIVGEAAQLAGDPEVPTALAFAVVALVASGHYSKALLVILAGTLVDLLLKEFGGSHRIPEQDQ